MRLLKRIFFVINLIILTALVAFSQNKSGLELRNYNTNTSKFIAEGSKVRAIKDGKTYKGKLKVISDQLIVVNSDTLLLSQIQEFSAKTTSTNLGGVALLVPGTVVGGFGLYAIGVGIASYMDYGLIAIIIGTPFALVGITGAIIGVKLLSKGRKFVPSKWEYKAVSSLSEQTYN